MTWSEVSQAQTHLGTIEYRDVGEGPVLVFLHLILGDATHWDKLPPLLEDRFRCIVPTLPMGAHRVAADPDADLSPGGLARAVAELLGHLDVRDVTLVGNDTGGALAQVAAVAHPERLARVVLTNCDMYDVFPPKIFSYFKLLPYVPGSLIFAGWAFKVPALRRLPFTFGRLCNEIDATKVNRWANAMLANKDVRRDALKVIRGLSPDVTNAAAASLSSTTLPFLLVWGADDRLFKQSLAERFCSDIPTAELVLIEGSNTLVCWDQPEQLADHIAAFAAA